MAELADAHVHAGLRRYGPVEDAWRELEAAGVAAAVLVQHHGEFDNSYLRQAAARHPGRFRVVAGVDPEAPDALAQVDAQAGDPLVRGVRLRATDRTPGGDGLAIWRRVSEAGLVASVAGPFDGFVSPQFRAILDQLPGPFRVENLGNAFFDGRRPGPASHRAFLALADHPGVHLVWSSFHKHSATGYPWTDGWPFLHDTLAAFSAERIMWSGDCNRPGLAPGDYRRDADLVRAGWPFLTPAQRSSIAGGTARRLFGFEEPT